MGLKPSLLRCVPDGVTREAVVRIEKDAIDAFKKQAYRHVDPSSLRFVNTDLDSMCLMRHYGGSTRTLDWTTSIYVGAYFAVREHAADDGSIWAVNAQVLYERMKCVADAEYPTDFNKKEVKRWLFDLNRPSMVLPFGLLYASDRVAAQQSSFTVSNNPLADHAAVIENVLRVGDMGKRYFAKFIIPHDFKPQILQGLRGMNITANSLFPGIDGLGRSVQELVQLSFGFAAARLDQSEGKKAGSEEHPKGSDRTSG